MPKTNGITIDNVEYIFTPPTPSDEGRGGITKEEYDNYNNAVNDVSELKSDLGELKSENAIQPTQINGSTDVDFTESYINGYYASGNGSYDSPVLISNNSYCYYKIDLSNYSDGDILSFYAPFTLSQNIIIGYDSSGKFIINKWITNIITSQNVTGITWNSKNGIATMDVKEFCEAYNVTYIIINALNNDLKSVVYSRPKKSLDWLIIEYTQMPIEVQECVDNSLFSQNINLPSTITCMVGKEFNIYNNGVISDNKQNMDYIPLWSYDGTGGKALDDGYRITPTIAGSHTLTLQMCKQNNFGMLVPKYTYTSTITVIADKTISNNYNVMFLGDSRTNNGNMSRVVKDDIPSINLIGTRGEGTNKHEGRNGWLAESYCTVASLYDVNNPFYNSNNPQIVDTNEYSTESLTSYFDFSYYCQNQGITHVDAVNILLGVNDNFTPKAIRYIGAIIKSIHIFDNNIKIYLMTEYVSPKSNYPTIYYYRRYYQFRFYMYLTNIFSNKTNVTIIPTHLVVDGKYDFMYENYQISDRVTLMERRVADAIHLIDDAYGKLSDAFETYFKKDFS